MNCFRSNLGSIRPETQAVTRPCAISKLSAVDTRPSTGPITRACIAKQNGHMAYHTVCDTVMWPYFKYTDGLLHG